MPKVTQITDPTQPAVSMDIDRLDRIETASMQLHSLLAPISGELSSLVGSKQ
ncbi:hypothetical protein [Cupriavidus nantongensis]|uniref:hypothetical protein n=1 Tax=Cupriavidus nantongensis TaxID=1796606 RepID=UPI000B0110AB|nr:hypothetical protein [Cupriavidus nantongensis]